jgi:hypothetical protein
MRPEREKLKEVVAHLRLIGLASLFLSGPSQRGRLSRHGSRSGLDGFQDPFRVRDPAQQPLDTQERGVVIASWQSMADWLAHAVSQQDA